MNPIIFDIKANVKDALAAADQVRAKYNQVADEQEQRSKKASAPIRVGPQVANREQAPEPHRVEPKSSAPSTPILVEPPQVASVPNPAAQASVQQSKPTPTSSVDVPHVAPIEKREPIPRVADRSQSKRDENEKEAIERKRLDRIARVNNLSATEARRQRQQSFDALSFEEKKAALMERQVKLAGMIERSAGNEYRQAALRAQLMRVQNQSARLKEKPVSESGGAFGLFSAISSRLGMGGLAETLSKLGLRGAVGSAAVGLAGVGGLSMFLNSQGQAALSKREEGIGSGYGKSARDVDIERYRKMGFDKKTSAGLAVRPEDQRVNEETGRAFSWVWGQVKNVASWGSAFMTNSLKMLYHQAKANYFGGDVEEVYRVAAEERIRREGDPNADVTSRLEARLENARRKKEEAKKREPEYRRMEQEGQLNAQEIRQERQRSATDYQHETGQLTDKQYATKRREELDAEYKRQEDQARLSVASIDDKRERDIKLKSMLDAIGEQKKSAEQSLKQSLLSNISMPQVQMPALSNMAQMGLFASRGESVLARQGLNIQEDILAELKTIKDEIRSKLNFADVL